MRDITTDLKERLTAAELHKTRLNAEFETERRALEGRYRQRVAAIESEVVALKSLLDIETRRLRGDGRKASGPSLPIGDFFVQTLLTAGPKTKEELRDLAIQAGYFHEGDVPGRSSHATIINLLRSGKVRETGTGHISAFSNDFTRTPLNESGPSTEPGPSH
jgi:hypothetical protein